MPQTILDETKSTSAHSSVNLRKGREISLTLRYAILKRDGFRCVKCGGSPATQPGVQLHIDHVQPWTKGGVTSQENLQTLCEECNLGKSNRQ
ncbi:MAG: HNH endonuclease [Candidatus Omnitrophica bacterium]|nr:HNH endonuclease [Candidatus Omnitrophota bacterium]